MSTLSTRPPPGPTPEPVFRLSVDQYHAMIETGVLTEEDAVELLEGILVPKMSKSPSHRLTVRLLTSAFDALLPAGWHFVAQDPITLDDGEPEPDGVIVRGDPRDFARRNPGPADIALVIEVAETTLQRDRGIKLRSYARAGIAVYWIVDLVSRAVEVYALPDPSGPAPAYRQRQLYQASASIAVELDGRQVGVVQVADILG